MLSHIGKTVGIKEVTITEFRDWLKSNINHTWYYDAICDVDHGSFLIKYIVPRIDTRDMKVYSIEFCNSSSEYYKVSCNSFMSMMNEDHVNFYETYFKDCKTILDMVNVFIQNGWNINFTDQVVKFL